jgi:hypothetical protein
VWCFVCGREYQSGIEQCWQCEVELVSDEPPEPLLTTRVSVVVAGPDYGERYYDVDAAVIFAAACEVLIGHGWVLRVRDPGRGAIAGSTRQRVGRRTRVEEIALYLIADAVNGCRVRCAIQYSGSRQTPFARERRNGDPGAEVEEHLVALDALLDLMH